MENNGLIALLRMAKGKLNTKTGKMISILVLVALMAGASASVFAMYYGEGTATVRDSTIQLVAGSDTGGSDYPNATVTVAATDDFATVDISMFASATNTPQPATYFTDLLQVYNAGSGDHTITQITISGITDADSALGNITVYYCTAQTDDPANNNVGVFYITSTTGGDLLSSSQTITAGDTDYIEIVAYAADTAVAGNAVTFDIGIQWT